MIILQRHADDRTFQAQVLKTEAGFIGMKRIVAVMIQRRNISCKL
jgi:hypothetical protein